MHGNLIIVPARSVTTDSGIHGQVMRLSWQVVEMLSASDFGKNVGNQRLFLWETLSITENFTDSSYDSMGSCLTPRVVLSQKTSHTSRGGSTVPLVHMVSSQTSWWIQGPGNPWGQARSREGPCSWAGGSVGRPCIVMLGYWIWQHGCIHQGLHHAGLRLFRDPRFCSRPRGKAAAELARSLRGERGQLGEILEASGGIFVPDDSDKVSVENWLKGGG